MTTRTPLCIFHGACDDGFGAALAVHLAFDGQVELFHGVYQQPPPPDDDLRDRDVIFVDFCYKRDVMEGVARLARSVLILDHHKTAAEDLAHLPRAAATWAEHIAAMPPGQPMSALFDMNRSGAMLAWNYFHPTQAAPMFFEYLQDRDLWLQKLENGLEFTIALRSYPQDLDVWKRLMYRAKDLIEEGFPIARYYRQKIEEIKTTQHTRRLGGFEVPVCNAPYFAASEVAGELAPPEGFAACYFHNGQGWQFSLRSRGSFDVGRFARFFGGGGHKQAAGFTVDALPWAVDQPHLRGRGVLRLTCAVCGDGCRGRQWHNRDDGYGFCSSCALESKESAKELESLYGRVGVHYFLTEAVS